ncbi:HAD family phosphatase [Candidatus Curtissbacteria bacterium]|nr:HAD family phosphatase [Candidatus Curtissbacteria bacterium]
MEIKAIIFDFYGVICSEIAPFWFGRYFSEEKAKQLKEAYFKPVDRGEVLELELFGKLASLVNSQPEKVEKEFKSFIKINDSAVELIKKLKPNYKIGVCTNSPSNFFRSILKQNNLTDLFDEIVVSSDHKVSKPDPKIFRIILDKLQSKEEEALFIDDNPQNISVAKNLGTESVLFINTDQLKNDLTKLGIM